MEWNFFYENLCFIPAIAFLVTITFKWIFIRLKTWEFSLSYSLGSGWMPSVHSAVITSLATAIAIKEWASSDLFAVAITLAVIVIYDAINVRYEAWRHGKALNKIWWKKKYKETLWHLPSEAFAWAMLWIVVAIILVYV